MKKEKWFEVGCEKDDCFYPYIQESNQCCEYCKYCIDERREKIKKEPLNDIHNSSN